MTSFSWVSGSRESSRNCMQESPWASVGPIAHDARQLHLPYGGPVIHHRIVLGAAVIPDRDTVGLPAPSHLILGDGGTADQIGEQVGAARRVVLAVPDILRCVKIGEVGGE